MDSSRNPPFYIVWVGRGADPAGGDFAQGVEEFGSWDQERDV